MSEPELANIMAESIDYEERLHVWKEWRRIVGEGVEPHYRKYVELSNKKAVLRGYEDYGALWRDRYHMLLLLLLLLSPLLDMKWMTLSLSVKIRF